MFNPLDYFNRRMRRAYAKGRIAIIHDAIAGALIVSVSKHNVRRRAQFGLLPHQLRASRQQALAALA